jgi:hypothetical protein
MIKAILRHSLEVGYLGKRITLFFIIFVFGGELLFSQSLKKESFVTVRLINGQTGAMMEGLETVL